MILATEVCLQLYAVQSFLIMLPHAVSVPKYSCLIQVSGWTEFV